VKDFLKRKSNSFFESLCTKERRGGRGDVKSIRGEDERNS
jgi:hypothetical protein